VPHSVDHLTRRSPASLRGERTASSLPARERITHPTWHLVMYVSIAKNRPQQPLGIDTREHGTGVRTGWNPADYPPELCEFT
jgi:hypothetical protein